ncbi:uncharacterized protein LOC100115097 [Nasonia vitripennis]|uniref:Uncharacterized protein n=1 Tax=Nasonia vitripennis TaxID=7425 RepID=A0A7M7G1T2_NASVI|nr:uncharacterized protein LOC100115097 [Nasonia vitripennis]
MGDEYKMHIKLGDEAICPTTLRHFRHAMGDIQNEPMQIVNENEIVLPERIAHYEPDSLQIVEVNVHEHFNENVGSVHNQPQQENIITRSEASAEEQISDLPYIESESEDAGILNYIRNFLMDQYE